MPFAIDIDPVAATLLGIPVRWYGLVLVVAASVAVWLAQREGRRRGIEPQVVWDAVLWVGAAALVGGRVLYVIQNELGSLADHPAHLVMVWVGGLSFYGGLIGALIALVVFSHRRGLPPLVALDIAAPAAAAGQAIGHLGCLIGGDSYGVPTSLPWAVIYRNPSAHGAPGDPAAPHAGVRGDPPRDLFTGLWLGRDRLGRIGEAVAAAYLIRLATIRFELFYLRDEPAVLFGLKTAQLIGLGVAALAVVLFIVARQTRATSAPVTWEASRP